jgi:hypothetical protein
MKIHVLQTITPIYRIPGSQPAYCVVLGYDHGRTVTRIQLDREQLSWAKRWSASSAGRRKINERRTRTYTPGLHAGFTPTALERVCFSISVRGGHGQSRCANRGLGLNPKGGISAAEIYLQCTDQAHQLLFQFRFQPPSFFRVFRQFEPA